MRKVDHGTWTETVWEVGDLVRVDKAGYGDSGLEARVGEWGAITDAREGFRVKVDLNGFSRGPDGLGSGCDLWARELSPWTREPRDEAVIARNVGSVLATLAWACGRVVPRWDGRTLSFAVPTTGIAKDARAWVRAVVVPDLLPFLGSGGATVDDDLNGIDCRVNHEGHLRLDALGVGDARGLAGGGNAFELAWERRGAFAIHDLGTGIRHRVEGARARKLHEANRKQVGALTDGSMPEVARLAIPYPRTLRRDPTSGTCVVETDAVGVEVRYRGEEPVALDVADSRAARQACRRVVDLDRWLRRRHEPSTEASPSP